MCEISAFTGFATPAPRWLRTPAIPKAKTGHPTRAAAREATIGGHPHESGIKKARAGAKARATDPGRKPGDPGTRVVDGRAGIALAGRGAKEGSLVDSRFGVEP